VQVISLSKQALVDELLVSFRHDYLGVDIINMGFQGRVVGVSVWTFGALEGFFSRVAANVSLQL